MTIVVAAHLESYMTTAQDLSIIAAAPDTDPALELGDLSLALAGAELIDLIDARAVTLDGDRLVPGATPRTESVLLLEAAGTFTGRPPHDTVEDWLWRRGPELAERYRADPEAAGPGAPARSRRPFRKARPVEVDTAVLSRANDRWTAREPVLAALAAAAGIGEVSDDTLAGLEDDQGAVLTAVHHAITQLAAERQRRSIEGAAFDNIWRGY
ncbi:GPP34 family phosphoprotein [Streptomyces sp. NPDC057287]|uniref:GPP34 family phosphoprotein n=1 Tax=Streptomyces sp. NPDC057287 TaxID=3346086 RepID=UPI003628A07C